MIVFRITPVELRLMLCYLFHCDAGSPCQNMYCLWYRGFMIEDHHENTCDSSWVNMCKNMTEHPDLSLQDPYTEKGAEWRCVIAVHWLSVLAINQSQGLVNFQKFGGLLTLLGHYSCCVCSSLLLPSLHLISGFTRQGALALCSLPTRYDGWVHFLLSRSTTE